MLEKAGADGRDIAALGIDFTACTLLPVDRDGTPLCFSEAWAHEPHAWVKLWKHHAAQPEADEINRLAAERGEDWLLRYGGKLSCEWVLPKILEVLRHAPTVFEATDRFTEAGDWLSRVLTGKETHSAPFAGYKACWCAESGYPSDDFFTALDPALHGLVGTRLAAQVAPVGGIAGNLNAHGAELTGLPVGTPLSLPMIDGHAAMPAMNLGDGEMMLVVGTSSAQMLNARRESKFPVSAGIPTAGLFPGFAPMKRGSAVWAIPSIGSCATAFPWTMQRKRRKRDRIFTRSCAKKRKNSAPGRADLWHWTGWAETGTFWETRACGR